MQQALLYDRRCYRTLIDVTGRRSQRRLLALLGTVRNTVRLILWIGWMQCIVLSDTMYGVIGYNVLCYQVQCIVLSDTEVPSQEAANK